MTESQEPWGEDKQIEPYENTLTLDELRREVRQLWDQEMSLNLDMLDLPEVPSVMTMRALTHAAMNTRQLGFDASPIGKRLQREHRGAVPYKTEYECATGLWSVIRAGILAQRAAADADKQEAQ